LGIEVRGIVPEETDDLIRAVAVGFGGRMTDRDLANDRLVIEPDRAVAAIDGDDFVGGSSACSFTVSVTGAMVPCAGITSVAVLPTHRRRGILTAMMRRLVDDAREREPLSILWASEGAIYGRFGYGMATHGASLSIERPHTGYRPGYRPSGSMRLVGWDEAMKIVPPVYDLVAARYPGFVSRNDAWLRRRFTVPDVFDDGFGKEYFFAIHEGEKGPDGYVAYRVRTDWGGQEGHTIAVEELMGTTPGAYADLWRLTFDMDLVRKVRAVTRTPREPLLHMLADPNELKVTLHDGLWVRLLRVEEGLAARRYASEGRLVLEVADPFCPRNEGRYELIGGPQGAVCRPTDAESDLRVTAEDLGSAYLGGVSFRDLARAGRLAGSTEILARADAMFGWDPPPWCPFVF
jgi:predicted acetyltransferase